MKIVFLAIIIGDSLCIIYGFLLFFSKITFHWKLLSDCCDQFGYQGSIVYLSCYHLQEGVEHFQIFIWYYLQSKFVSGINFNVMILVKFTHHGQEFCSDWEVWKGILFVSYQVLSLLYKVLPFLYGLPRR